MDVRPMSVDGGQVAVRGQELLERRQPAVAVDGYARAVIAHANRPVGANVDADPRAATHENLIVGVCHEIEDHVDDSAPIPGVADKHAGTLPDGVARVSQLHATKVSRLQHPWTSSFP